MKMKETYLDVTNHTFPRVPELHTSEDLVMNIRHASSVLLVCGVVDTGGMNSSRSRGWTGSISGIIRYFRGIADTPELEASFLPLA